MPPSRDPGALSAVELATMAVQGISVESAHIPSNFHDLPYFKHLNIPLSKGLHPCRFKAVLLCMLVVIGMPGM